MLTPAPQCPIRRQANQVPSLCLPPFWKVVYFQLMFQDVPINQTVSISRLI